MGKLIGTRGIVLSSSNMFESDRVLVVFCLELGKVQVLAKWANTKKFRFGGKIDVTTVCDFELFEGKSFWILRNCDLVRHFLEIRADLERLKLAAYMMDVVGKATSFGQVNAGLYELLLEGLESVGRDGVRGWFQGEFLRREGLIGEGETVTDGVFERVFGDYVNR